MEQNYYSHTCILAKPCFSFVGIDQDSINIFDSIVSFMKNILRNNK